jgi:hypothetical protein
MSLQQVRRGEEAHLRGPEGSKSQRMRAAVQARQKLSSK